MKTRRVVAIAFVLFVAVFGGYLWVLYGQLKMAFETQDQFIPTRIYSDMTRITPPQARSTIDLKLKTLGYSPQLVSSDVLRFVLHARDYPDFLIPEGHPQIEAMADESRSTVTLQFSGGSSDDLLQSIELDGKETPDIYLEPELVASLAHGSTVDGRRVIRQVSRWENPATGQSDFPPQVWKAIIATEDPRFMDHRGLDPRGLARALWVDLRTRSLAQGGSTITQQLVKNLMARHTKSIIRKVNELFLSLLLDGAFPKERILERYLNEVYLGQVGSSEIHGVAEGAELIFGKELKELNLGEIALMAGLIRGTAYYSPYKHRDRALERQHHVLKRMVEAGYIAQEEADEAARLPIRLAPPSAVSNKAPYFTDYVKAELLREFTGKMSDTEVSEAGFRVYTTLDLGMSGIAQTAVSRGIEKIERLLKFTDQDRQDHRLEGALAAVDQSTGFIRALVGGRNYGQSTFNRILNMKRQVGSTFKPIVYLTAIEKGSDARGVPYGPGHPIEDSPWTLHYDHGRQSWAPRNYEKGYLGWISYRTALAHSINTSTARLGFELGIPDVIETARRLGIESDLPAVPSLTLGVAELSPIELLRAYAAFANHGMQNELTVIRAVTDEDGHLVRHVVVNPNPVAKPGPVDLLTDMLTSVFTEGTAQLADSLGFERPAAGKTGTTSHHRDAWFAGYTPQLTTVVWVGMDQPHEAAKVRLTGANSALPIWVDFMKNALADEPPSPFPLSSELTDVRIDQRTGLRADSNCPPEQVISEKFIKDHEPQATGCGPIWPAPVHEAIAD